MIKLSPLLRWTPVALPLSILALVYFAWLIAFIQLGRPPLPSMDDPKYIGGFATHVYSAASAATVVLFFAWLLSTATMAVVVFLPKTSRRCDWWLKIALGISVMALLLASVRFSPGGACGWFVD